MIRFDKFTRVVPILCLLLTTAGCVVGPDYQQPEVHTDSEYTHATEQHYAAGQKPETEWWQILQDDMLGSLVRQAVSNNHDLRIARANVNRARALLGETEFDRYPTVTSSAGITREESSEAATGSFGGIDRNQTFYNASLDATWELDFFGRVQRSIEALTADRDAAIAEQRNVHVIVTAEVARTYLELRGAQYRLQVAKDNAENQRGTYDMTRSIMEGGLGTNLDIVRSRAQLESTLARIPQLKTEISRAIHRIGVLTGQQPGELFTLLAEPAGLPLVPERIAIGNPGELLQRRPDIRAAERQLAASTARIGVATADLFPRVSLGGSIGYLADSLSGLGDSDFRTTSFGPFLTWPAFDLGRVRARIRATDATAEASLAVYEQTVLLALEETENALVRFANARQRQGHLQIAAEASANAVELARVRYSNGADSFLNVLDAERQLLELQDQLALSETESGLALVALYKSLGGGWENAAVN